MPRDAASFLQCTAQLLTTKIIQPRTSILLRLRNPVLEDPERLITKMPQDDILTYFSPSPLPKLLIATWKWLSLLARQRSILILNLIQQKNLPLNRGTTIYHSTGIHHLPLLFSFFNIWNESTAPLLIFHTGMLYI